MVSAAPGHGLQNDLDLRPVRVDVPATTANLGAGFDALALALDLSNRIDVEPSARSGGHVELIVEGEGADRLRGGRGNRFLKALRIGLEACDVRFERYGWRVRMQNMIPLSRGLGSSATASVGGLLAARALSGPAGRALSDARILALSAALEGHPDNAAAAVYGGFVVVAEIDGALRAIRLEPPKSLVCALFIPDRPLSTAAMRAALPQTVPLADAVHNLGATALAVTAMATGDLSLLRPATVDRLHEPYRAAAVYPELPSLVAAARYAGALGACLSGAGSTVICFADSAERATAAGNAMAIAALGLELDGRSQVVAPRLRGATVSG
jgi:homoserine kinase